MTIRDPINDDAWIALCEGLATNKSLTELRIGYGFIDSGVCEELTRFITRNKFIKLLQICHNKLGYRGTRLLCEALKQNDTITSLILCDDSIDSDAWIFFKELLDVNKTISELVLHYNPITYTEYINVIDKQLKRNEEWRKERRLAMKVLAQNIQRQGVVCHIPKELWNIILSYNTTK